MSWTQVDDLWIRVSILSELFGPVRRTFEVHFCWVVLRGWDHALGRQIIERLVLCAHHSCLTSVVGLAGIQVRAWSLFLTGYGQILRQSCNFVAQSLLLGHWFIVLLSLETISYHSSHVHSQLGCLGVVERVCSFAFCVLGAVAPARELVILANSSLCDLHKSLCQGSSDIGAVSPSELWELLGRNAGESSVRNYAFFVDIDCDVRVMLALEGLAGYTDGAWVWFAVDRACCLVRGWDFVLVLGHALSHTEI